MNFKSVEAISMSIVGLLTFLYVASIFIQRQQNRAVAIEVVNDVNLDVPVQKPAPAIQQVPGPLEHRIEILKEEEEEINLGEQEASKRDCPVCFSLVEPDDPDAFRTRCGHWFHREDCFNPWFERSQICATCRGNIGNDRNVENNTFCDELHRKSLDSLDLRELVEFLKYAIITNSLEDYNYLILIGYMQAQKGWNIDEDVDKQSEDGKTMLMLAAASGNLNAVMALVQSGATIALHDHAQNDAMTHAVLNGKLNVAEYLAENV